MELSEKDLFLPLALARRGDFGVRFDYGVYLGCRPFDAQGHWNTLRSDQMQDCDGSALRRDVTKNSCGAARGLRGLQTVSVPVRIRQMLTHQSFPGECASMG